MSFLLDKAIEFGKHGPFGPKKISADEQKLRVRSYQAANTYRRIVIGWLNRGVSEQQLRDRDVWISEFMQPNVASMGGGPGPSGGPAIIPVLTPGTSRPEENTDPNYLAGQEEKVARVEEAERIVAQSGEQTEATILRALDSVPPGSVNAQQEVKSESGGARSEHQAEIARLWPHIARVRPVGAGQRPPQFLNMGWESAKGAINPRTGKPYSGEELAELYAEAIRTVGGELIYRNTMREVFSNLLIGNRELLTHEIADERIVSRFHMEWREALRSSNGIIRLQELIGALNALGYQFPKLGTKGNVVKNATTALRGDDQVYPDSLELLSEMFPTVFQVNERAIEKFREEKRPPPQSPSSGQIIEAKMPQILEGLSDLDLPEDIQGYVRDNFQQLSTIYSDLLRSNHPDLSVGEIGAHAIIGLMRSIRRDTTNPSGGPRFRSLIDPDMIYKIMIFILKMHPESTGIIDTESLRNVANEHYIDSYRRLEAGGKNPDRWLLQRESSDLSDILTHAPQIARRVNAVWGPHMNIQGISEEEREMKHGGPEPHPEHPSTNPFDEAPELTESKMDSMARRIAQGVDTMIVQPMRAAGRRVLYTYATSARRAAQAYDDIEYRRQNFNVRARSAEMAAEEDRIIERLEQENMEENKSNLERKRREEVKRETARVARELQNAQQLRDLAAAEEWSRLDQASRDRRLAEMYEDYPIVESRRASLSAGGAPPPPPPPGGNWVGIAIDGSDGRHFYRSIKSKMLQLLLLIGRYAREYGVSVLKTIIPPTVVYEWVKSIMFKINSGEVVKIDVKDINKTPSITDKSKGQIPPNSGTIDTHNIPSTNMTDIATYEMGIDGKPKLFPMPTHALSYNGPANDNGTMIPWNPDAPRFTVMAPKITTPGGTITEKDQIGGFDTENEQIVKLMNARPDIADHIFEYNSLVNKYNTAILNDDKQSADQLRAELYKSSQMIVGEAALKPATVGLGISEKDIQQSLYSGKTISGEWSEFYAHKAKNERTARLGLDRDIDEYNYLADRLNDDTYQERTPLANVRHELERLRDKINAVEIQPEYGIGRGNAKFISSKYPERIRELANLALQHEPLNLSRAEEQMLKEYPEIGTPVLRLSEFQKHHPAGTPLDTETAAGLESVQKLANQHYELPQARSFAEGAHRLSPTMQRLVDRIANATPESERNFILTKEERAELERYPDLKEKVERYETEVNTLAKPHAGMTGRPSYIAWTPETVDTVNTTDEFRMIRDAGYRANELAEYSMAELDERLRADRAAVQEAYSNFQIAQASGASRSDLMLLYQRLNIAKSRLAADQQDAAGRGTFLADRSRELLPQTEAELKQFQQLQAVEAALQGEPNVLLEYNNALNNMPMGQLSPVQYYEHRLKLLRDAAVRAGVSQTYDQAISQAGQPMDETIVNLPDDAAATERQGEGTERANTIDPDESKLFMMSGAQNRKQFQNWLKFSYVAPGFGLGGPAQNPLARCNASMDARRFAHAQNVPAHTRKPMPRPHEDPMRYQQMINPTVSSFGRVHMKDPFHDNYVDPMSKRVIWSNPFGDINSTRDVRRSESIYDPDYTDFRYDELTGTRYGSHPVRIGEISKPAEYRFTNERYYDTNGFNYKQQNELNLFAPEGDRTMITKDRAGLDDRGIIENRKDWHTYGRTRMRPLGAPGFRSTKF